MTTPGHNGQLKAIVERIEHVESEVKELNKGKAEIYLEAKGNGFDLKALRRVIALRKLSADDRQAQDAILDTYLVALGMV
jgi:uncharacterized protein (UPF0335 family)